MEGRPRIDRVKLSDFARHWIEYNGTDPGYGSRLQQINNLVRFLRDEGYQIYQEVEDK